MRVDVNAIVIAVIAALGGLATSSGLWGYVQHRQSRDHMDKTLLRGLAYSTIVYQGRRFLDRGWISPEEYSDYYNQLYIPYRDLGGNGSAERIIKAVDQLPLKKIERPEDG